MSWQLGAFAILLAGLAAGFAWYERTRPDARVLALVATLAAFAALGRIAFAALPNVKPTTDIVLISGYALGGAPGLVVGALAGLSSNFFFGQGPWTPWQMAAWGVVGLIGAGLGAVSGKRIGRLPLAVVCAASGFAFTVVQDLGDWVNYSDHTLAQLGVYVGKGIGFDAIHAAGCFAFALAFGPALARSIGRFAARLQVRWHSPGEMVVPAVLLAVAGLGVAARPGEARVGATRSPTDYLVAAQNRDGGFGPAPGAASTQLFAGWAALGLAAEGREPSAVSRRGRGVIAYLRAGVGSLGDSGSLERTILAVVASGLDPARFGGRDLATALGRDVRRDGSIAGQTNLTSFGLLALRAAGRRIPPRTAGWLISQQDADGGFNYSTAGAASDVDDTGAALEALAGVPENRAARVRAPAVRFIERQQDPDGGFPAGAGTGSNAQSTAWGIQGLIAAGVNPATVRRRGGPSPLQYLRSLIAPDGHVRYSRSTDQTPVWVTAEAMMALAGRALPLRPRTAGSAPVRPPAATSGARPPRAVHRARATRRPTGPRVDAAPAPRGLTMELAADAGILDALALAPVGLG